MAIVWPDWTHKPGADMVFYRFCSGCGQNVARLGFNYHRCTEGPRAMPSNIPDPTAEEMRSWRRQPHSSDPPCHARARDQWCDRHGPGGFMGHTCYPPVAKEPLPPAIPMILTCPACGGRHIDEGDFATRPHHTHACQHCGTVWRPAIVATVGVQFLPGFKNSE